MHVGEVEHGADPAAAAGDRDDVVEAAEVVHAAHHLDAERHRPVFAFEALPQLAQLLADRLDRRSLRPAEEEAGVEHHDFGAGRLRDPRAMIEHPDRHALLLVALDVAHEAGDRRVHRERDLRLAGELPEPLGPRIAHPEAAFEVDLAGGEPALLQDPDGLAGAAPGRHTRRAESNLRHASNAIG